MPVGQYADKAIAFIKSTAAKGEPSAVLVWRDRNKHGLNQLWARDKDSYLQVKKELEIVEAAIEQEAAA